MTKHVSKGFDAQIEKLRKEIAEVGEQLATHRSSFVSAATGFMQTWYGAETKRVVTRETAITLQLGERISLLKNRVRELEAQASMAVSKLIDVDDLWSKLVADRNAFSGAFRPPREFDTELRQVAGLLGPVLEEFGFLDTKDPNDLWRAYDASGNRKLPNGPPYYPYGLDWSQSMIHAIRMYTQVLIKIDDKEKEITTIEKAKQEAAAEHLWDSA